MLDNIPGYTKQADKKTYEVWASDLLLIPKNAIDGHLQAILLKEGKLLLTIQAYHYIRKHNIRLNKVIKDTITPSLRKQYKAWAKEMAEFYDTH